MNKKEIQKRVLKNGEQLDLDKFEWDETSKTFSSSEYNLVIDFNGINYCTFKTGSGCTFDTSHGCTFKTGEKSVVVRRDVYEVIELDGTEKIKLNEYNTKGYEVIKDDNVADNVALEAIKLLEEKGYRIIKK